MDAPGDAPKPRPRRFPRSRAPRRTPARLALRAAPPAPYGSCSALKPQSRGRHSKSPPGRPQRRAAQARPAYPMPPFLPPLLVFLSEPPRQPPGSPRGPFTERFGGVGRFSFSGPKSVHRSPVRTLFHARYGRRTRGAVLWSRPSEPDRSRPSEPVRSRSEVASRRAQQRARAVSRKSTTRAPDDANTFATEWATVAVPIFRNFGVANFPERKNFGFSGPDLRTRASGSGLADPHLRISGSGRDRKGG